MGPAEKVAMGDGQKGGNGPGGGRRWLAIVGGVLLLGALCIFACIALGVVAYFTGEPEARIGDVASPAEGPDGPLTQTVLIPASAGGEPFQASVVNGIARTARGATSLPAAVDGDPEAQVRAYLDRYANIYPMPAGATLVTEDIFDLEGGGTGVRLGFEVDGLPLYGAGLVVQINPDNDVVWAAASYPLTADVDTEPQVSEDEAATVAIEEGEALMGSDGGPLTVLSSRLVVFNPGLLNNTITESMLAREVEVANGLLAVTVLVDATSGEVVEAWLDVDPLSHGDPAWTIYSLNNTLYHNRTQQQLEAARIPLTTEAGYLAGVAEDAVATNVSAYIEQILAYYLDNFGRRSYDGRGRHVTVYVHAGPPGHRNARWSGSKDAMFIGDGVAQLDAVAHEFTHAFVNHSLNLVGKTTHAGALRESLADVFAVFMTGDWVIGEDGLPQPRDLTQPRRRGEFEADANHMHRNSRILSHAAYLIADNSAASAAARRVTAPDGTTVTWNGLGMVKAQQIYYRFLANGMSSQTPSFHDVREALIAACLQLHHAGRFGLTREDCGVIPNAFAAIDVGSVDRDFDTVADLAEDGSQLDNCQDVANAAQHDDDANDVGDACDDWIVVRVETKWRTADGLCNDDNPPSTAAQYHRLIYYLGRRMQVQPYIDDARRAGQLGAWRPVGGGEWENFEISQADVTEVSDEEAGRAEVEAIRQANPGGQDSVDDAFEVWTVWPNAGEFVPLTAAERQQVCADDNNLGPEPEEEAARWVLVETEINPGQFPLQDTSDAEFNSSYDGTIEAWTVSATSMTALKRTVYLDETLVDVSTTVTFDAPPDVWTVGEVIMLRASGTMAVSVAQRNPFEQFQYENDGAQIDASYFQVTPDNPSEQVQIEITAPAASPGAEWVVSAALWNCSACRVNWVYELQE